MHDLLTKHAPGCLFLNSFQSRLFIPDLSDTSHFKEILNRLLCYRQLEVDFNPGNCRAGFYCNDGDNCFHLHEEVSQTKPGIPLYLQTIYHISIPGLQTIDSTRKKHEICIAD